MRKVLTTLFLAFALLPQLAAAEVKKPLTIYHAFNMQLQDVKEKVCDLKKEGYDAVQISPTQKSNSTAEWWARYQPFDYSKIEGLGSEADLKALTQTADQCGVQIISDVVFNHMQVFVSKEQWKETFYQTCKGQFNCNALNTLFTEATNKYPQFSSSDFRPWCSLEGSEWDDRGKAMYCWGDSSWPELRTDSEKVRNIHKAHLDKLIDLGVKGFRFDAVKMMTPDDYRSYVDHINWRTGQTAFVYGEILDVNKEAHYPYTSITTTMDFTLLQYMRQKAFLFGGDLRSLQVPDTFPDPRAVTFARNHDTVLNAGFDNLKFSDFRDAELAWAYILSRQSGTPLVFRADADSPIVKTGVKFRQIMSDRGAGQEYVLSGEYCPGCSNHKDVLMMTRGGEGFVLINKSGNQFNVPWADLTLTLLEGCYRELRYDFTVAIEKRSGNKKYVTRWGTWQRGGFEVGERNALYFVRAPFQACLAK